MQYNSSIQRSFHWILLLALAELCDDCCILNIPNLNSMAIKDEMWFYLKMGINHWQNLHRTPFYQFWKNKVSINSKLPSRESYLFFAVYPFMLESISIRIFVQKLLGFIVIDDVNANVLFDHLFLLCGFVKVKSSII